MKRLAALCAVGVMLLSACGGDGGDETSASGGVTTTAHDMAGGQHTDHVGNPTSDCAPAGTSLTIAATGTKFDKDCLAAPASQAFTISFDNKDTLPHNIAILESHTASEVLFRSDISQGPGVQSLRGGALKAGVYAFHCEVHPALMSGTFVVR